jgi:hypothetical protein
MTVVVSDEEKASFEASGGDREGERKRIIVDVSKAKQVASEPGCGQDLGMSLAGVPFYWPGGVRHVDDASPVCGFRVEQEKACPDTPCSCGRGRGSVPSGDTARDRVPMPGALADRLVVAVRVL